MVNVNRFAHWYHLNEPKICLGLGITTMVGATALTGWQTVKAVRVVDAVKAEKNVEKLPVKDIFKEVWKYYIPPALLLVASGGLFIRGYLSSAAAIQSSIASYNFLKESYQMYKDNVKDVIGEKKESEVRAKIAEKTIEKNPPPKEECKGPSTELESNLIWCYDNFSGRYFKSNMDKLNAIEAKLNKNLIVDDWVSLNDLYYEIGLDFIVAGERNGWSSKNGRYSIHFNYDTALHNDRPVLVLGYDVENVY